MRHNLIYWHLASTASHLINLKRVDNKATDLVLEAFKRLNESSNVHFHGLSTVATEGERLCIWMYESEHDNSFIPLEPIKIEFKIIFGGPRTIENVGEN